MPRFPATMIVTRLGLAWLCLGLSLVAIAEQPLGGFARGSVSQPANGGGETAGESRIRLAEALNARGRRFDPMVGLRSTDALQPQAIAINNRGAYATVGADGKAQVATGVPQLDIYHQPLIQIKLRIIEVIREDSLAAKTILDYVRRQGSDSRIAEHNLNGNQRGTTTSTRFPAPALAGANLSGSGGIVNLTSSQLNLIGEFLATEFKADLVTCPQVVTLNGQKVHLVSGANVPFQLGQSVFQNGALAIQQTFYKHVGTNLIITPRIVNWGPRGEGTGQRPITVREIKDWNAVAGMIVSKNLAFDDDERAIFAHYAGTTRLMTVEHRRILLNSLNRHARGDLTKLFTAKEFNALFYPWGPDQFDENGCPCDWKPSNCTVDVEVILRQSKDGMAKITDLANSATRTLAGTNTIDIPEEEVGAAIADVVQLRNGHGAVIAGLIGERDVQVTSKVPVLGDLPWIGAGFRSRSTNRQKTEIVIFLEAEVLPSDPFQAVPQAARDFDLTRDYLYGDVLGNPLEIGMQRAGFGSYLPPRSHHERIYWERLGRKVQKSCTDLQDLAR